MTASDPRLSVIVPTFDRRASVERLLDALGHQTLAAGSFEVIVSVDGSADGTLELVKGYRAPYALTTLFQPNRGRSAARNLAIGAARGDVLLILDDDMEPRPGCLAAHEAAHAGNRRRCVLGAVPIAERDSALQRFVAEKFAAHHRRLASPDHLLTVRDFFGGNTSIRRCVLLEASLFDEDFVAYGNEDVELAVRLRKAGVEIVFVPEAEATQHWNKSFPVVASETVEKGKTAVMLAAKHPEVLPELRLAPQEQGSRSWRALRGLFLSASRVPGSTRIVVWGTVLLQRIGFPRMRLYHRFILDCFFWLGARSALRELGPSPERGTAALRTRPSHETNRLPLHR